MSYIFFKKSLLLFCILSISYTYSQNDLKLHYNEPAVEWTEALPIGNGTLGAMVFGRVDT